MLSIGDDLSPCIEAKIATEIVVVAHWIQRHEYATRIAQSIYVTNQNSIITFDKPSTTIEFYLRRVPIHDPKLHLMGDLYLICRAKIGSLIQELTDKIRADSNHNLEKAVHYSGLDGRSRSRKVTISCLLDILKETAKNLIDFAPFVIDAMNKYYERERAMRILEGSEDMARPGFGFNPHQNVEPRIVSFCSKLSPFHIFAHLNEKHRGESLKEEQRLQNLFSKEAIEKVIEDGDPEAPRRAAFAVFEAVRDGAGSGELAACRDVSYFSDKNISFRYDQSLPGSAHKPSDSGYMSGATKEQLEEYNKLSSKKESIVADQQVFGPDNVAPQVMIPQPESQMTDSPSMQLQRLTEDVWTGYGCNRHVGGEGDQEDKVFDWDALIERYPASASSHDDTSDKNFSWDKVPERTEQNSFVSSFAPCGDEYAHDNCETDNSSLHCETSPLSCEDEARTVKYQDNHDEQDGIPEGETLLHRRAHTMALLEGKDENANAIVAAWDEGKVRTEFLAGLYAPDKRTKKGFFSRFRNITR